MEKNVKCFYHSADHDGRASGYIVSQFYGGNLELYGINYGQKFPWNMVSPGDTVVMVDFCLEPFSDMIRLYDLLSSSEGGEFIWIDHHKSSLAAFNEMLLNHDIDFDKGLWDISVGIDEGAACLKAWKRFFVSNPVPYFIKLISFYDTWQLHENQSILPFHYGLRLYNTNPENTDLWHSLNSNENVLNIILEGKTIIKFVDQENESYAMATSFETELDGYRALAINRGLMNSRIFESIEEIENFDIQILFSWMKNKWKIALFSVTGAIDVSKIAVKHGGGGHPGAAGFLCDNLPFKLK